jgi:hypothetical protein
LNFKNPGPHLSAAPPPLFLCAHCDPSRCRRCRSTAVGRTTLVPGATCPRAPPTSSSIRTHPPPLALRFQSPVKIYHYRCCHRSHELIGYSRPCHLSSSIELPCGCALAPWCSSNSPHPTSRFEPTRIVVFPTAGPLLRPLLVRTLLVASLPQLAGVSPSTSPLQTVGLSGGSRRSLKLRRRLETSSCHPFFCHLITESMPR